ncbi:hypothetical protein F4801DRAFT_583353 [Xylaria longipes]|nr:hypothetical protein F4801DRAFT_583353 [Xylaria longipes]
MAGKKQPAPTKPSKGGASKPTKSSSSRAPKPAQPTATENCESEEERKRQQTLLNIFGNTFRDVLEADDFAAQLQEVKGALFNRDFEGAFAHESALDVYAARWSPTRALCYARVLHELDSHLKSLVGDTSPARVDRSHNSLEAEASAQEARDEHESIHDDHDESAVREDSRNTGSEEREASTLASEQGDTTTEASKTQPLKILAIGGAAAEIVAFADYISRQANPSPSPSSTTTPLQGDLTLLDIGPWDTVISRLQTALTSTPPISRYASAAAKAANAALVSSSRFRSSFVQKDILSLPQEDLSPLIPLIPLIPADDKNNTPILITLLFTLNELYTAGGIKRTTAFLRLLSSASTGLAPGSLLLVVDSPGSYSEAAVGGGGGGGGGVKKKRYPMQWLLEHTLIPPPSRRKKAGAEERPPADEGDQQKPTEEEKKEEEKKEEEKKEEEKKEEEKKEEEGEEEKDGIRWEKIESRDSVWFRVADGLRYPIPLENMRYQMHLYRACVG